MIENENKVCCLLHHCMCHFAPGHSMIALWCAVASSVTRQRPCGISPCGGFRRLLYDAVLRLEPVHDGRITIHIAMLCGPWPPTSPQTGAPLPAAVARWLWFWSLDLTIQPWTRSAAAGGSAAQRTAHLWISPASLTWCCVEVPDRQVDCRQTVSEEV